MTEYSNTNQIVLSIPGVIDEDEIAFSDVRELEGAGLKEKLREQFDKGISIENDMHCIAYGYKDNKQVDRDGCVKPVKILWVQK